MGSSLTPTEYILRCGPEHCVYGDPYVFSANVQVIGNNKAYISGASGDWGPYRKEVLGLLFASGIRTVEVERLQKDGTMRTKVIPVGDSYGDDS